MQILQEVGLVLELSQESLELLARKGLKVDMGKWRMRFPLDPILETIQQLSGAPMPEITKEGTAKPVPPLRMPTHLKAIVGANTGCVYDIDQGMMRPATHQDMYDFIKVKRRLEGVGVSTSGIFPQDVPQDVASVYATAGAVKHCENPGSHDVQGLDDLPWVERVMQAAGAWGPGQHKAVGIYPISPLRLAGRGAEMME